MAKVAKLNPGRVASADERQIRIDLAAAFRLAVEHDWHESIGNHFSAALSADGKQFLMNPKWMHFSRIRASDLLALDVDDPETMKRPGAPEITAWCIHGAIHAALPHARVIMHLHPTYATVLASLADPQILPIDQNTARYYNRVSVDSNYGGFADAMAEGERLAQALGNGRRLMMGNHGVLIVAPTVAEAFEDLYYFERSCRTMVLAYSTGQPLGVLDADVAERTARNWESYLQKEFPAAFLAEMKAILDAKDPSYAD